MKICIPLLEDNGMDSRISDHFGKSPFLSFYDDETSELEIIKIAGKHAGGQQTIAEIVLNSNADILICSNIGPKAIDLLKGNIYILTGAAGNLRQVLQTFKMKNLRSQ